MDANPLMHYVALLRLRLLRRLDRALGDAYLDSSPRLRSYPFSSPTTTR
jgi:hypothetical protein